MSTRTMKSLVRSLAVVPALFIFNVGPARAAGDAQELARATLLGVRAPAVIAAAHEPGSTATVRTAGDAQDLARRVLLGATSPSSTATAIRASAGGARGHGDAQVLAHQVLLGHRAARTVGS